MPILASPTVQDGEHRGLEGPVLCQRPRGKGVAGLQDPEAAANSAARRVCLPRQAACHKHLPTLGVRPLEWEGAYGSF